MRHRIFIAINFPEKIKNKLLKYQNEIDESFYGVSDRELIRLVKRNNLHITLVFLGYVQDEEIPEIINVVEEITEKHNPFPINLDKICYGPPKKMPPRMVWAEGKKSEELGKLQNDLENSLFSSLKSSKKSEARPYRPHITLGRISKWGFKQIEPEERPRVEKNISLRFQVNSVEIMESQLKREGAEYTILKSSTLGPNI